MRILSISPSALDELDLCPRLHLWNRLLRLESVFDREDAMPIGRLGHIGLAEYYRAKQRLSPNPIELAVETMRGSSITSDLNPKDSERVIKTILAYHKHWGNEDFIIQSVEQKFNKILYLREDGEREGLTVMLNGVTDLDYNFRGNTIVADHKMKMSSWFRPVNPLSNALRAYCWALGRTYICLNYVGVFDGPPEKRFRRQIESFPKAKIEDWLRWARIKAMILDETLQAGVIEPRFSACMSYGKPCQFIEVCGAPPEQHEDMLKIRFGVKDAKAL